MIPSSGIKRIGIASATAALLIVALVGTRSQAQSSSAPPDTQRSKLRILYAGQPGSEREKDFVGFLKKYFETVETGSLQAFKETDTQGFDVTLLDWSVNDFDGPKPRISETFSRPMITLGVPGGLICSQWRLKTGYLWNCMDNAAHAELLDRDVYRTPLTAQPQFEFRATPQNYRETYQGPGKLPDQIKVWRVQKSPEGNVVARWYGFLDSPDAEVIAVGFNDGKEYGAIGIGRQGNFLQWGYGDPPSQMTEAGRRLFVNCIHYIHRFDGQAPLVRRRASDRQGAVSLAAILTRISGDKKEFFLRTFPESLWEKYHADPDGLAAYYKANLELVYWDGVYRVDEELKSLGLASNRKAETLERLFVLLRDETHRELAHRLLARYTDGHTSYDFDKGRDRIYFSDVGGYKFFVVPEGYLLGSNTGTATNQSPAR